jgi:nucleotide-binding universal stress UspA family protein
MDAIAEEARAEGVVCETVQVEEDQPYQGIIDVAEHRACDLIVMASHGRSGITAIVLGSVTTKVLTYTKIPVLVCH